jgi:hypothetical protein
MHFNSNNNQHHYQNSNKQNNNNKNQYEQNYIIETSELELKSSHLMQSLLSKNSDSTTNSASSKSNDNDDNTSYKRKNVDELEKIKASKKNTNQIGKLEESRLLNSYNYRYQILHPSRVELDPQNRLKNCNNINNNINNNNNNFRNFLQIKLKDIIDVNREKIFIDNLYAQFYSDSNIINLVYVSPMDQVPENSILLDNSFLNSAGKNAASSPLSGFFGESLASANISTNKLLNDFYINAALRRNSSSKLYRDFLGI